jgi:hypothetical protein
MNLQTLTGTIGLAFALAASASQAWAGDWSIQAVISQELNAAENRALREDSAGVSFGLISNTALDFRYAMPDGSFNISTDLTNYLFFGEADEDGDNDYLPHLGIQLIKSGRRDTVEFTADYQLANVGLTDINGTPEFLLDDVPVDTIRDTLSAGLVWTHKIDNRDTLVFSNLISSVSYNDPVGTDNDSINSTLEWERKLSQRTTLSLTGGVNLLMLKDGPGTDRYIYSVDGEIATRLTKRLTLTAGAGIDLNNTEVPDRPDPDLSLTSDFSFGLEYALKTLKIGFDADYGLAQGPLGDFREELTAAVTVDKTINDRSSLSVKASIAMFEDDLGGGIGSDYTLFFSPTYSLALTDEWTMKAGYRYTLKNAGFSADSNLVFVSMTRDFTVLP